MLTPHSNQPKKANSGGKSMNPKESIREGPTIKMAPAETQELQVTSLDPMTSAGTIISLNFEVDVQILLASQEKRTFRIPLEMTKRKTRGWDAQQEEGLEEKLIKLHSFSFFQPLEMPGSHFNSGNVKV